MTEQIADVLDKAADVIEERGWTQGWYQSHRSSCLCALGAINVVTTGDAEGTPEDEVGWALSLSVEHAFSRYIGMGVPSWNDKPERTADQVVDTLRAAAASERTQ